jgi:palmitoyltransferase
MDKSMLEQKKGGVGSGKRIAVTPGHNIHGCGSEAVRIQMGTDLEQPHMHEATEQPLATLSVAKRDGRRRWCDICKIAKPDRCHHCSECDKCVLRMDHHCPWVGNCIGYSNHKFFYLFILYASMAALWVVATMVPLLISAIGRCDWNNMQVPVQAEVDEKEEQQRRCVFDGHWVFMTVVAFILALLIVSFTGAHTVYILKNRTTIESLQDVRATFIRVQYTLPDASSALSPSAWSSLQARLPGPGFSVVKLQPGEHLWDRGSWMENWKSIMGLSWWLWFRM